ncbi:hypothetical protein SUGI_0134360 [Cryptomeria japonica]|nr:hypothetical protein SUGI_0134360 [Cryptomeria japonica]
MDHLDASMANTCLQNPLWDYTAPGISAISNSFGTWMILVLALVLTLWGFRGTKVFCIGFIWRGKSARVRVMVQSSCFSSSGSGNNRLRKTDGVILSDDLNMYRKMNLDDLELPSCRKQATTEKGCHRSESKSSSLCDSLILCDARESDRKTLCSTRFIETEMMIVFEKSLGPDSPCKVLKSVPLSPLRDPFSKPVLRFPSFKKWECVTDNFGSTFPRHNQVSLTEEFRCSGVADSVNKRGLNKSPSFSSSELVFHGEKRDKLKGIWFVFNHDNEEHKGEKLWMLDPFVGFCNWEGLESFESQCGLNKLLLIKSVLARNKSRERLGLNAHSFPEYFIQDPNHTKVWQDNCDRRPQKLLGITEDVLSSTGNVVRLWNVQVAKCLNETLIKDSLVMVNHIKNGCENEPLCSSIVTGRQNASLVVWDSRIFAKPVSYRLGNKPSFHNLQLIDNKFYFSDELNNTTFDLRMLAATPVEFCPVTLLLSYDNLMQIHNKSQT